MPRLALLIAFFLSLPAAASAGPAVLYAAGVDPGEASTRAKAWLGNGDFTVEGPLAGLIEGKPQSIMVVGAPSARCASGRSDSLERSVAVAGTRLFDMEYADGLKALQRLTRTLPCGGVGAPRATLYQLHFLQGIAHFNLDDFDQAREAFRKAAIIDPQRPWDEQYPPQMKELFVAALQDVVTTKAMPLELQVESLLVDGEPASGKAPRLLPGRHILASGTEALVVDVPLEADRNETSALVTTAVRLVSGLSNGDDAYAPWLADRAAAKKWTGVLLVTEDTVHQLDGRVFLKRTAKKVAAMPVAGASLIGVGAGTAGAGLALHLVSYREAGLQEDGRATVVELDYGALLTRNRAGFATAIAGGVLAGVGVALVVAATADGGAKKAAWAPYLVPSPDGGLAFGIGGRF